MKPTWKKLLCAALAGGVMFCSGMASAAIVTDKVPILTYADHTVSTYDKPGGRRIGFISPNVSLVQVKSIRSDGWAYGSYAIAEGKRVARWFEMRELQGYADFKNYSLTIDADRTVYRTSQAAAKLGSVLLNAQATVIGEEGNYLKIIYRVNGGSEWKMGWIEREVVPYNGGEDIPQEIPTENENGGSTVNVHNEINIIIPNQNPTNPLEDKPIEEVGHNPQGEVEELKYDEKSKMLTVKGWAYDEDNLKSFVKVKVYVGGDRTTTSKANEFYANLPRSDEKGNHGFLGKITLNLTASQEVYVYALNLAGTQGEDQQIGTGNIRIAPVNHDPQGKVELIEYTHPNIIHVKGWAYDEDDMNAYTRIEVYVGFPMNAEKPSPNYNQPFYKIHYAFTANQFHKDAGKHGFDDVREVNLRDLPGDLFRQEPLVHVYAMNDVGDGVYKEIGNAKIDIPRLVSESKIFPEGWYKIVLASNPNLVVERSAENAGSSVHLSKWTGSKQQIFYLYYPTYDKKYIAFRSFKSYNSDFVASIGVEKIPMTSHGESGDPVTIVGNNLYGWWRKLLYDPVLGKSAGYYLEIDWMHYYEGSCYLTSENPVPQKGDALKVQFRNTINSGQRWKLIPVQPPQ